VGSAGDVINMSQDTTQQQPSQGWGVQPTGPATTQPVQHGGAPPTPTIPPTTAATPAVNEPGTDGLTQTTFIPADGPTTPTEASPQVVVIPPADAPPTIQECLRTFAKDPGCSRYSGDAEKVKLLVQYLWIRQLVPTLPFEKFLELFAPIADFNKENLMHPGDAIKEYLPRSQKAADATGRQKWSAKDVVDYLAVFIDMIREAERTNEPIPCTLNQFLTSEVMIQQFNDGAFKEATPPKKAKGSKKKQKVHPNSQNQRCIYTGPGNRQYRGVTQAVWQDEESKQFFADFKSDEGQEFKGIGVVTLEITDAPLPQVQENQEGDPLPVIQSANLKIRKVEFANIKTALDLVQPVGTVAVGDTLYEHHFQFNDGRTAYINVVNGEVGNGNVRPYVDAFLSEGQPQPGQDYDVVDELRPRTGSIVGTYTFTVADHGTYVLEVSGNE